MIDIRWESLEDCWRGWCPHCGVGLLLAETFNQPTGRQVIISAERGYAWSLEHEGWIMSGKFRDHFPTHVGKAGREIRAARKRLKRMGARLDVPGQEPAMSAVLAGARGPRVEAGQRIRCLDDRKCWGWVAITRPSAGDYRLDTPSQQGPECRSQRLAGRDR